MHLSRIDLERGFDASLPIFQAAVDNPHASLQELKDLEVTLEAFQNTMLTSYIEKVNQELQQLKNRNERIALSHRVGPYSVALDELIEATRAKILAKR